MSYILEALKKSERTRALRNQNANNGTLTALETNNYFKSEPASAAWLFGVLFGIIIILFLMLLWILWQQQQPIQQVVQNPMPNQPLVVVQSMPATPEKSIEKYENNYINNITAEPTPKVIQTTPKIQQDNTRLDIGLSQTSQQQLTEIPNFADLPEEFSQNIPDISIDIHSYTQSKNKRFVLLNSKHYREGDYITEALNLVEITPSGIILSYQGVLFRMDLNQALFN